MFCNQCEETVNNKGCTKAGVCGKTNSVANLQDTLLYVLKAISYVNQQSRKKNINNKETDKFVVESLFSTITNVNFSKDYFFERIKNAIQIRDKIKQEINDFEQNEFTEWSPETKEDILKKSENAGIHKETDTASLKETLLYGIKGISAYLNHANVLSYHDSSINEFIEKGLIATVSSDISKQDLVRLVMECGNFGVKTMALLDLANTETYGNPEPTKVSIQPGDNPGILISGHDLLDMKELLDQTKDTGIDIYTHGEMLPANAYPEFKKYSHFKGNYGGSWWKQQQEFEKFNGPILMTTNCLMPPKISYKDRLYTTGLAGFKGVKHIENTRPKDFSEIIETAKNCNPPEKIEKGSVMTGFAHNSVISLADKIIKAVKSGKIKGFVVMAGCDGRHKSREYYTEFAKALPHNTVILTAGCAKYRYNKLDLEDIDGIPRVIDAGQCNDSYSLVVIAKKLAEVFGEDDINNLPISYNIAWYEQKAVIVLLALLSLGVKDIMLGPRLPAFVSPGVLKVLQNKFNLRKNSTVEEDINFCMYKD
ncbi:hydroxylamine reductase [Candidatus Woesearchaeota archaeon]|nr:hydroxylamine reductase [Candidatus Woesearchaeota archaeon]